MQFELMRISLLKREQIDAFERKAIDGREFTREEWLRSIFSAPFTFMHRGNTMHYVPEEEAVESPLVVGRVGRQVNSAENEPPEAGLHETKRLIWRASLLAIDPRHHSDGQKVAFEEDPLVGIPLAIMNSLARYLNEIAPPEPYVMEISAIADAASFWEFAASHRNSITSVTFEFIAPNMFGTDDDYDREMRDMRDNERARKAKLRIENPEGLNVETERVRHAVNYTVRGGGSIKARTKDKKHYNSDDRVKRINVPEAGIPAPLRDAIIAIYDRIFRQ